MNTEYVEYKEWWKSKTVWFNVAVFLLYAVLVYSRSAGWTETSSIIGMAFILLGMDVPTYSPEVELGIVAVGNLILRAVTDRPIRLTSEPQDNETTE